MTDEQKPLNILWISDMDVIGSGYLNITVPLCDGLSKKGHNVKVVGLGYKGQEHFYPFSIIPCAHVQESLTMFQNIYNMWHYDALIVAMDLYVHNPFLNILQQKKPFSYIAISPIEAPPLCMTWAMVLSQADKAFIISEFGAEEARRAGVMEAEHLQIGIDTDVWQPATLEEKKTFRSAMLGIEDDTFVVLTIADNQERKNLAAAMEIFKEFSRDKKALYVLVTRENSPVGWRLRDYAQELGITNKFMLFERGMPFKELWMMYACADCFLMTSKSEGLCTLPTTGIWTETGKSSISTIQPDQKVISHTGKLCKVTKGTARDYHGDIVNLQISYGLPLLSITPEHPIYGAKKIKGRGDKRFSNLEWIEAKDIKKGDYIFYPKSTYCFNTLDIDVTEYLHNVIVLDKTRVHPTGKNQYGDEYVHPMGKSIPKTVHVTDDFLSLLGWYISEGCYTGEGTSFSFHSDELDYQREVKQCVKSVFGYDMVTKYRERHRCDMRFYGTVAGKLLAELCGYHSHEKHLPSWVLWLPKDRLWKLLRGMFLGDGNYRKKDQWLLRYSTVSKRLAEELQFVLSRIGILASLKTSTSRVEYTVTIYRPELCDVPFINSSVLPPIKKCSSKMIKLDDGYLLPISSIKITQYSGQVFNLEVENDNSYLTDAGSIHNCMPLLEAMAMKIPCIGTDCTGMKELLGDNRGILVGDEYKHRDPFGNGTRWWIDKAKATEALRNIYKANIEKNIEATYELPDIEGARKYVEGRDWQPSILRLEEVLLKLRSEREPIKEVGTESKEEPNNQTKNGVQK